VRVSTAFNKKLAAGILGQAQKWPALALTPLSKVGRCHFQQPAPGWLRRPGD
jgi:hypothetical protein